MLCHRILLIVPPTVIIEITLTTFKQLHILFKTLLLWFGEKRNMVFGPQSVFTTIFLKFLNFSYPHEKVYFGTNWTHQKSMKLPQKTDLHRKLWRKVHGFILFHEGSQGPPTAGRYPHEKVWTHDHTSTQKPWRYEPSLAVFCGGRSFVVTSYFFGEISKY